MKNRRAFLLGICVILAVVLGFSLLTGRFSQDYTETAGQQLEEAIRRAAVACYGSEGIYPPNMAYMKEHYGIDYDTDRYIVHYELFASNVMPEISVLKK